MLNIDYIIAGFKIIGLFIFLICVGVLFGAVLDKLLTNKPCKSELIDNNWKCVVEVRNTKSGKFECTQYVRTKES